MPYTHDGYKSSNDDTPIEVHPKDNGSTVRKAFLIESLLNLLSIPLITHPRTVLSYILINPAQITPATILFARFCGGIVVGGLTTALWTGLPNTKTAIESRRTVYLTLGFGEALLLPILGWEAMKGSGRDAALSVKACWAMIACLAPPLLWRIYCLFVQPNMMGRYREVKRQ